MKWNSGKTSYIALKDIKEINPVEIAEYVKVNNIDKETAFSWWVPSALKLIKNIYDEQKIVHDIK